MHDARPVLTVVFLGLCGTLLLLGWWGTMPPAQRQACLVLIALQEDAATLPPTTLQAQAEWLLGHRVTRSQGLTALAALSLLIAGVEGVLARRQDRYAGFRLSLWTCGLLGVAVGPGLYGLMMVAPWPIPLWLLALVTTTLSTGAAYGCLRGRPYVP
jgi:hypothetical protein